MTAHFRKFFLRWFLTFILLALIGFGWFLLFSQALHVRQIHMNQLSSRLDRSEVQTLLAPLFGRHIVFLSELEILSLLKESIPDIADVEIMKEYPSDLHVRMTLDPLTSQLRIVSPDFEDETATGATLDYLTNKGIYVQLAYEQDIEDVPEIYIVDWGVKPIPGTLLLTPYFLNHMRIAEEIIQKQFGYNVEKRSAFVRAQEFHLDIGQYTLWLDVKSSVEDQISRYKTLLSSVDPASITEYVDLRIAKRIVYK